MFVIWLRVVLTRPCRPSGTGEHGVGIGKRGYLYEELGEGTVELMNTIKRTIDPLNLFNPGKVRSSVPLTRAFLTVTASCIPTHLPSRSVE